MAKRSGIKTSYVILGVIVVVGLYWAYSQGMFAPAPGAAVPGVTPTPAEISVGYSATVNVPVVEKLTGTQLKSGVNAEIWYSDNTPLVAEWHVDAYPDAVSTMPNSLNGYLLVGNDNYASGTDRGDEVYYHKESISYSNKGVLTTPIIYVYNETTPTFTGYDDGTVETTTNITVGSGETITSTELKIKSASDACIGNPDFSRPLAICFNGSTAAVADKFDEIRPTNYDSTISVPGFLSGKSVINGKCYVLPTAALCDYSEFRFYLVIDAKTGSNPAAAEWTGAILLDKTYFKNDLGVWESGWEDASDLTTDSDIGIDGINQAKVIHFN